MFGERTPLAGGFRRPAENIVRQTKVVTAFNEIHIAQMIGYLAITGLKVACS